MEWQTIVAVLGIIFGAAGTSIAAWYGWRGKRGETQVAAESVQANAIAERWDDASELAKWMQATITEKVEREVERQVKPLREKLEKAEAAADELKRAVRVYATQLWLWDRNGRPGGMPALPNPLVDILGLGHLWPAEHTEPEGPKEKS